MAQLKVKNQLTGQINFVFMNTLKKFFIALMFGSLFLFPVVAHAVDITSQLGAAAEKGAGYEKPANNDPRIAVANFIKTLLSLLGILFLVMTLYAGFTIMTAGGDDDKVAKGKKTLFRSVLGIVVILAAYSITVLAYTIATGDAKHQDDYVEIKDRDNNFQQGNVPRPPPAGCPYGLDREGTSCASYSE